MKIGRILISAYVYEKPVLPAISEGSVRDQLLFMASSILSINTEPKEEIYVLATREELNEKIEGLETAFYKFYAPGRQPKAKCKNESDFTAHSRIILSGENTIFKLNCTPVDIDIKEDEIR